MAHRKYKTIRAVIPRYVGNKTLLGALELMRHLTNWISTSVRERNRRENLDGLWDTAVFEPGHYIENQAQWGRIRFGNGKHGNMAYSGCEIIATCNGLLALGEKNDAASMAELISFYEKDGALLNGEFGVSPGAIRDFFRKRGYEVSGTDSRDPEVLDIFGTGASVLIVTAWNDRDDIMAQIHTVCMTKSERGGFLVHNAYRHSGGRYLARDAGGEGYATLTEAIAAMHPGAAPVYTLSVRRPASTACPQSPT